METTRTHRSHYKILNGALIEKVKYATEMDALTQARFLNSQSNTIHKMVAYKCAKCNYWHIGSNSTILTIEDKEDAKKKLEQNRHKILIIK